MMHSTRSLLILACGLSTLLLTQPVSGVPVQQVLTEARIAEVHFIDEFGVRTPSGTTSLGVQLGYDPNNPGIMQPMPPPGQIQYFYQDPFSDVSFSVGGSAASGSSPTASSSLDVTVFPQGLTKNVSFNGVVTPDNQVIVDPTPALGNLPLLWNFFDTFGFGFGLENNGNGSQLPNLGEAINDLIILLPQINANVGIRLDVVPAIPFFAQLAETNNGTTFTSIEVFGPVTNVSIIPIPASVWIFTSGLFGLLGIARRKKAA